MREGMGIFTDYTNKWKARPEESRRHIEAGDPLSFEDIKEESEKLAFSPTKTFGPKAEQYKPDLPLPKKLKPHMRRISFVKRVSEVDAVAEYLFEDTNVEASIVGEKCFDLQLKEARK